jgi:hypothetical protein
MGHGAIRGRADEGIAVLQNGHQVCENHRLWPQFGHFIDAMFRSSEQPLKNSPHIEDDPNPTTQAQKFSELDVS